MIVLRVCALGDLVVTGPLLERLPDPFLVAHSEHVALARAAGWVAAGTDAELAGLHTLYAGEPDPARLAPALRERLARGEAVLVLGRPGEQRDALVRGLRAAGAREVRVHDPLPPRGVHAADHLAAAAGEHADRAVPRIDLPADLHARGAEILRGIGLEPHARVIAIHPGAGSVAKRWPVARWAEVVREVEPCAQVAIVCGPADADAARDLGERLGAPLLRDLPLLELAAALTAGQLLLGHDSGVSHLSAALGVPTLALFGPTDPRQWAPRGRATRIVRAPRGDLARLAPACVIAAVSQTSSR